MLILPPQNSNQSFAKAVEVSGSNGSAKLSAKTPKPALAKEFKVRVTSSNLTTKNKKEKDIDSAHGAL